MHNFHEWCKSKKLEIPVFEAKICKGAKAKHQEKLSGKVHAMEKELDDYEGHMACNGTVDPFKIKSKKK